MARASVTYAVPAIRRLIKGYSTMTRTYADVLQSLPGYPFLPCPICLGTEGCDHSVPERARTTHPSLVLVDWDEVTQPTAN